MRGWHFNEKHFLFFGKFSHFIVSIRGAQYIFGKLGKPQTVCCATFEHKIINKINAFWFSVICTVWYYYVFVLNNHFPFEFCFAMMASFGHKNEHWNNEKCDYVPMVGVIFIATINMNLISCLYVGYGHSSLQKFYDKFG
jgi:hypothetical protein